MVLSWALGSPRCSLSLEQPFFSPCPFTRPTLPLITQPADPVLASVPNSSMNMCGKQVCPSQSNLIIIIVITIVGIVVVMC